MENNYKQLCVWPGVVVGIEQIKGLEEFFLEEFGTRVKYEAEVTTNPDLDEFNQPVPETGGRNDLLFYVHDEDIHKFAVPRLQIGIRWWEDVVYYNDGAHLYSEEILNKYPTTW